MIAAMSRPPTDVDARALADLGEALGALRRERGLSQADAGRRLGMTSQGWGLYEAGRRPGLFRPDVQRRLLGALDATPEDLALRLGAAPDESAGGAVTTAGLASSGRDWRDIPQTGQRRRLTLSDDDLAPWAASGVIVEYEPGRWPRQGQGCVVEGVDGSVTVRLYEGGDAATVSVRGGPGGLAAAARLDRSAIARLSAVTARIDI